jgi:predicted N-acetyltransferase YhbS
MMPHTVHQIPEMQLSAADDAAIAGLLARCFTTDFGGRSFFIHHHHLRLVIRDGGAIISHVALMLRSVSIGGQRVSVAGLAEVATDPAHRGQGHAATLLHAAIEAAKASPAAFLLLFGQAGLYGAAGFWAVPNPVTQLDLQPGASAGLMVLALQGRPWPAGVLDLRGPEF